MKKFLTALLALTLVVAFFSIPAQCQWWLLDEDEDAEEIVLFRVDSDPDAPKHETNEGKYGFYETSQNFVLVLNFYDATPIQSPYTWDDVEWIPGPLDL